MTSSKNKALPAGTVLRGAVYAYTIEKVLGQGAFGITYLASTLIKGPLGELSMPVAVKEFFAKDLDSRSEDGAVTTRTNDGVAFRYAKAFQRESQNLSKMKHPGIVKVLEAFQANGTYYYSMEYLPGGSLDDKVKGEGIPEEEALPMIEKIGEALSFMHRHKMMHLDLKPKNIMLKADGTPVIIDFGISKQFDDNGEPESSTSIGLGSPGYAPIEQATQTTGGEFQPTLDIYALGATLYKMLTGKTPPAATLVLNKKATLTPDLQAKDVSSGTIDAIRKAMAPLMDDRPQQVEDFLSMLAGKSVEPEDEAEDETELKPMPKPTASHAPAEKPSVILSGSEESKGKPKPKTWLWALLGGLSTLAVILAFVFGGKGRNQGAGGDSGADTLAVVPVDSIVDTSVTPPVNNLVPEASGSIKITSEPIGATIWLDGKNTMKQTPEVLENVAPGKHAYKLVLDGYKSDSGSITVTSGQRVTLSRKLTVISQEKTQEYYNTHESEILPDAQAAFRDGNYDRAAELCKWHYIIVGDNRADELRDKAERCAQLTTEMNAFVASGQLDLSQERAQAILSLNPDDKKAQELGKYDPRKGVINGREWVDLGLSVKWATCNVGASSPEEYGSYFAWGETKPKSDYSWSTLKYCEDTSGDSFSKYNTKSDYGTVDNKTRLDMSDDAARANWGGSWRMPTRAEQDELRVKCTWTWTTRGGKNGYKVTGKNGNSIFLPAAGCRHGASLDYAGSDGWYWSSSLHSDHPYYAYGQGFSSDVVSSYFNNSRYPGFPVRPVSE